MKISYAQNFEDVMLWRALGHVQEGFYIDIGAQDPVIDSVSLMFHEKGWRGIHVEPTVHYAGLLRQQRPGDTVIQAAVGDAAGVLPLFEIPGTGISTLESTIAAQHREHGFDVHETTTPIVPLSTVLALAEGHDVHWMKIDVEGFERQVLASWGDSTVRPWVVVVESTLPLTQIESHDRWEGLLIDKGYTFVYFDGLNRYYVSDKHPQLRAAFAAPPNVFDEFALNGTASASFHLLIQQKYEAQLDELRQRLKEQMETAQSELSAVRSAAQVDQEAWIRSRQELEHAASEARAQLASVEHALEAASQQLRLHAEREHSLQQQLEAARAELLRAERETAQLHAALGEQLHWAMDALQAQTRANAEAHALAHRLVETHQAQLAEQTQMHAQREREMAQRLDAQLDELRTRLKVQADLAQAELLAAKAQAKAQLQATEQAHSVAQQALHSDIARLQARTDGAERLVQQLQDQLEASRLDAQARQQDAQAQEAALRAEVAAQQARLQALQSALDGLAAERSLLETSVLGRLSLRQMRRKRAAQGHAGPVPVAPASTGGSAAPTSPPSLTPSIDMPPTTLSLDPDQARLEDLLGLHDAEFVQEAFRLLLGRAADPQGLAHYLGHVRQGRDKRHILMDIYSSSECKTRLATQPSLQRFFPGRRTWLWPGIGPLLRKLDAWLSRREVLRRLRMIDNDLHRYRSDVERQLQRLVAVVGQSSFNAPGMLSPTHSEAEGSQELQVAAPIPPSLTAHGRYLYRLVQHSFVNK